MNSNDLQINITCSSDNEDCEEIFYENVNFEHGDYLGPTNYDLRDLFEDIQRQHHISQKRINAFKRRYEQYCQRNNLPYSENSDSYIKCFRRYYGLNPERKSSDTIKRPRSRSSMRKLRQLIEDYETSVDHDEKRTSKISIEKQASCTSIFQCFCFKLKAKKSIDEFEELLSPHGSDTRQPEEDHLEVNHLKTTRSHSKQSILSQNIRSSISFHTRSWQSKLDNIFNNDYANELKARLRFKRDKRLSLQFSLSSGDDNLTKDLKRRSTDPCLAKYEKLQRM